MRLRRIACLLLGMWLAGSILVGWTARENFASADDVIKSPPYAIQKNIPGLDANHSRMFLHYFISVEASESFHNWERIGALLLLVVGGLLLAEKQTRLLAAVPLALLFMVGFQHFFLTPEIVTVGQNLILSGGNAGERSQFTTLHRLYGVVSLVELLLGLVLAVWLVGLKSRRRGHRAADPESTPFYDRRY